MQYVNCVQNSHTAQKWFILLRIGGIFKMPSMKILCLNIVLENENTFLERYIHIYSGYFSQRNNICRDLRNMNQYLYKLIYSFLCIDEASIIE